jgi:hypothetical protein
MLYNESEHNGLALVVGKANKKDPFFYSWLTAGTYYINLWIEIFLAQNMENLGFFLMKNPL